MQVSLGNKKSKILKSLALGYPYHTFNLDYLCIKEKRKINCIVIKKLRIVCGLN